MTTDLPNWHPFLGVKLAWFTDLEVPVRGALGLTSHMLSCDRTEHRVEVDPAGAVWWPLWRRNYIRDCSTKDHARAAVSYVESAPGVMPARWWVAEANTPIVRAPVTQRG